MRVCVTGLRGLPDVAGGVETHCEMLLPLVRERLPGAAITVLARAPYCPPATREHAGLRIVRLWTVRQKHLEALLHTGISVVYARAWLKADVVHIHAIGPALLTPLARALGMRVIVTHHGADYRRAKWGFLAKAALRLGERLSVAWADEVIAVSGAAAQELRRRFPAHAARIRHLPNGAPPACAPASGVLERFGLEPRGFVLSVGRLVPEKGFADLIAAHARLADGRRLVIAGDADHAGGFSRALRAMAGERVMFTGRLAKPELFALYRACDRFVLASRHEGLPIAALEALAAGAPTALSGIPANRELGLPEACYFPPGDVAALAERLRAPRAGLLTDPTGLAAFDWARIADETAQVYRRVADQAL